MQIFAQRLENLGKHLETFGGLEMLIALAALLLAIPGGLFAQRRWKNLKKSDAEPDQASLRKERATLLNKIRKQVNNWLKSDLYQVAQIDLQLSGLNYGIEPALRKIVRGGGQAAHYPRGKPIAEIFYECGRQLLILGQPGAGKSTKLVELTKALLDRAEASPDEPVPVIFHLSTWSGGQTIAAWLEQELVKSYKASRPTAKRWVENDSILPLLDALDEVSTERWSDCLEAVNAYRQERGPKPIAICCREAEYRSLSPLKINVESAVGIDELAQADVRTYLDRQGSKLLDLQKTLRDDPELWDVMTTPLMLTVLFLASQGPQLTAADHGLSDPRDRLYWRFLERMYQRRRHGFSKEQGQRWLGWLASELRRRGLSPFSLEDLAPEWLPSLRAERGATRRFQAVTGLFFGLLCGLGAGLGAGLVGGLVAGLGAGLVGGLGGGLLYGLLFGLGGGLQVDGSPVDRVRFTRSGIVRALVFGLVGALVFGLVVGLGGGLVFGLVFGLVAGLVVGLLYGLLWLAAFGLNHVLVPAPMRERSDANEGTQRSGRRAAWILVVGNLVALLFTAAFEQFELRLDGLDIGNLPVVSTSLAALVVVASTMLALRMGGAFFLMHWTVRLQLRRLDLAPLAYVAFLDEAADLLLLRKIGGSYQFFHETFRNFMAEAYDGEWFDRGP